ncbi:sarcosine oxidase subunit gamma family protein [Nitratireductor sp. XY-223]|uniref:sarcosine oxidase subunit gamma n=1 Tax=Nitratireductor sp. XY-223 TaxID=2561926 RepID=UPI00145AC6B3|nr:sarcosine oxidase subunit gamma family protein [Nitratireductor sp. XY-223]
MPSLVANSPLGDFRQEFDGLEVAEVTGLAIVSIATPHGREAELAGAVLDAWGIEFPPVGASIESTAGEIRILGLQPGQVFALFQRDDERPAEAIARKIGDYGYYTDQSDSWAILRISGDRSREALERICALDLHPDVFKTGGVARTVMEHLGVIVLRDKDDAFLLLSARSSAPSFLHAVVTSAKNIQ